MRTGTFQAYFASFVVISCMGFSMLLLPASVGAQQNLAGCISVDRSSNSLTDFLVNQCSMTLNVRWIDRGSCRNGCALTVAPGRRESAGKINGQYVLQACEYPAIPRSEGSSQYSCN